MQILSGVLKPTSGNFNVEGKVASLLELGAGFNPEFTGKENIYLYASIFGLSSKVVDKKLDSIIKFSEIEEFIELPVKTYSTGMFVRLAFSVIAHLDADILLIDEAFAVGDSSSPAATAPRRQSRRFTRHDSVGIRRLLIQAVSPLGCCRSFRAEVNRVMPNSVPKAQMLSLGHSSTKSRPMPAESKPSSSTSPAIGPLDVAPAASSMIP